uniref:NADH-ubiquinone oxidoreductase chain 4L n=1 Tax=Pelecinus polyturator TaxID=44352 RepID=A0A0E3ELL4_9HYME|nr:NADH dehydrogenase subunit 4L [Pelecinus polyturator]AIW82474.1 NADH dehydrogenase subunit 4L [Pelecinus polyturator]
MSLFLCSLMLFTFFFKYMLLMLISLEFIMISIFYMMYIIVVKFNLDYNIIMYMMVFMVCEGVLGLSILVLYIRYNGSDMVKFMNLKLW